MARPARIEVPRPSLDIGISLADLLAPLSHPERVGEAQWQTIVEGLLKMYGWAWMRVQVMRVQNRFLTGTTARGWPDITAVRPPWIVFLELKSGKPGQGVTSPDQKIWIRRLQACGPNVAAYVVAPQQANDLIALLHDPARSLASDTNQG